MDLASGVWRLIITMTHVHGKGRPKIVPECTLPLTAPRAVSMIITDLAVFEFVDGWVSLTELMPGVTLEQVGQHEREVCRRRFVLRKQFEILV